jgi:hypothetical protein
LIGGPARVVLSAAPVASCRCRHFFDASHVLDLCGQIVLPLSLEPVGFEWEEVMGLALLRQSPQQFSY